MLAATISFLASSSPRATRWARATCCSWSGIGNRSRSRSNRPRLSLMLVALLAVVVLIGRSRVTCTLSSHVPFAAALLLNARGPRSIPRPASLGAQRPDGSAAGPPAARSEVRTGSGNRERPPLRGAGLALEAWDLVSFGPWRPSSPAGWSSCVTDRPSGASAESIPVVRTWASWRSARRQARELGGRLSGRTFSAVFVSPLKRALETCRLAGFRRGGRRRRGPA